MGKSQIMNFLLVCSLLFFSCQENDVPLNVNSQLLFPNQVGNRWVYNVYDSGAVTSYDVTVTISSTTTIKNKIVNIWIFKYPNKIDTNYVTVNSDTIIFFARDKITVVDTYVLPLAVGNKWVGEWINDNYTVTQQSAVSVNGRSFQDSFNIKENARSPNFIRIKDEWFTPFIGAVKRSRFEYDLAPPTNRVWYLKSWNL
jgi:hypothetical protein